MIKALGPPWLYSTALLSEAQNPATFERFWQGGFLRPGQIARKRDR